MKKSSVTLLLTLCLAACTPFMYGVPQESWDRMSPAERSEAMRIYQNNEQARRQAAEERARSRALEEQARRQAAEARARHEAREREEALARQAELERERRMHRDVRTAPFISGRTLRWETDAMGGQYGTIHVTSTDGSSFFLDQKNVKNTAAGITRLEGKIKDGKVIITNRTWNETWIGTWKNGTLSGKINNQYSFRIYDEPEAPVIREREHVAPVAVTAPFVSGRTLRWETDAMGGQYGTVYVTSTDGTSFFLDQKNVKNTAAGITRLEGRIKDGKIVITNRKWNETWVGTLRNGMVNGKINNQYTFRIFE